MAFALVACDIREEIAERAGTPEVMRLSR
jgi:hypothetical protein